MRAIIVGFVFAVMQVLLGAFAQQSKPAQNAADQIPLTLTISGPQTVTVGDTIIFHEVLTNVSNHLPVQPVDATLSCSLSAGV
jgi:hypothetical protein